MADLCAGDPAAQEAAVVVEIFAAGHRAVTSAGDLPVTRRGASGCRKG
ncbi:hypothetical protein ACIGW8_27625 [Streptomyces sioyaensis]